MIDTNKIIIIVDGPVASGKTCSCLLVKNEYADFSFIDLDILKDRTYKLKGFEDWENKALTYGENWRRNISYKVGLFWCKNLMELGLPIIIELCDTFSSDFRNELNDLVQKYDYKEIKILLFPDLETCLLRNRLRNIEYSKISFSDEKVISSYNYYAQKLDTFSSVVDTTKETILDKSLF